VERVGNDGFFSYRREVGRKKGEKGETVRHGGFFSDALEAAGSQAATEITPEQTEEATAALLDQVFSLGDRLRSEQSTRNLESYKQAVRAFLSAVVERGMGLQEHASGANILKRKRYTLVRVVDSRLEELAAGVVSSQTNQLELLAKVDEINGLLIDLTR